MTNVTNYISTTLIVVSIVLILWLLLASSVTYAYDQRMVSLKVPKESLSNHIFTMLEENELINYLRTNALVKDRVTDEDLRNIFLLAEQAADVSKYVDKALVLAVIATESNFDTNARNIDTFGLMQIDPTYQWARLRKIKGEEGYSSDLYDPYLNIFVATDYLDAIIHEVWTYERIPEVHKESFALMWYNMGPSVASDVYFNQDVSQYARIVLNRREVINDILTKGDVYRASAESN